MATKSRKVLFQTNIYEKYKNKIVQNEYSSLNNKYSVECKFCVGLYEHFSDCIKSQGISRREYFME